MPSNKNPEDHQAQQQQQETMTIVTTTKSSSVASSSSSSSGSSSDAGEDVLVAGICLARQNGQVCICETCEATRTRLLALQQQRSNAVNRRKRVREETAVSAAAAAVTTVAVEDVSSSLSTSTTAGSSNGDHYHPVTMNNKKPAVVPASATVVAVPVKKSASAIAVQPKQEEENDARLTKMSNACRTILECVGEDPNREGLIKTPERWAKALLYMCSGYNLTPDQVTNGAVFMENHDEMVVVRNIDIYSLCEHHMVPFTGRVHIGYIPNGKILGLSKLARIAELYARRLQVQERLTRQIADAVVETVDPLGVAVVVECTHMCMVMRGVQKSGSLTTTSSVRGCFESNSKTRAEFFSIIHGNGMKMC